MTAAGPPQWLQVTLIFKEESPLALVKALTMQAK